MHPPRPITRLVLASGLLLSACALGIDNAPRNLPVPPDPAARQAPPQDIVGEHAVALAFSGGGYRAAAFSLGVLLALEAMSTPQADLLNQLTFISSVSGGSLTAAYYGLHGRDTLRDFRRDVLEHNLEGGMNLSALAPANLIRLLRGGLNDRRHMADVLDRRIFKGATFAELFRRGKPDVWINASDVYNRVPFPFIAPVFAAACTDLASFPVAEAVSASMAVPLVFAPVVLRTYPDDCRTPLAPWVERALAEPNSSKIVQATAQAVSNYRDPRVMRFIKLADGGLTDNYGLSSILISRAVSQTPYGPLTAGDAVRLRRMLFIVVDAGRGLGGDWAARAEGPSGVDAAIAATDTAVDSAARLGFESFQRVMQDWREEIAAFRCSLSAEQVQRLLGPARDASTWRCDDVRFHLAQVSFASLGRARAAQLNAIATRLSLPAADIDAAIAGGRDATLQHPAIKAYIDAR